jgi:Domain of unknown function (DUF4166)
MSAALDAHAAPAAEAAPSPLDLSALLGARAWGRLRPAIRRRFASGHAAASPVYRGTMALDRSAIGLLFALLALPFRAPLPWRRAEAAPAEVRVSEDDAGGVVWERWLDLGHGRPPVLIRSTKRLGADGALLECVEGGLGMVLALSEEDGALVFESRRYFLALGGGAWRVPLPTLLTPGRCRVAHAEEGGDPRRFRFTLEMRHPLWGVCFRQTGLFEDPQGEDTGEDT